MNVYDFDNTLYRGESTLDFYFYCVKHHPKLIRFVFIILTKLVKYKMCLVSEDELMTLCKKYVKAFLEDCPDAEILSHKFWENNKRKLKKFYKEIHKEDDIIVSASFGFMLRPIMPHLGVTKLVCSEVNLDNGEIETLCFRKYKKQLFAKTFGDLTVDDVYTDSLNDVPLMSLAKRDVYLVKGEKCEKYNS